MVLKDGTKESSTVNLYKRMKKLYCQTMDTNSLTVTQKRKVIIKSKSSYFIYDATTICISSACITIFIKKSMILNI